MLANDDVGVVKEALNSPMNITPAPEAILKEVAEMQIFLIIILGIGYTNTLNDGRQTLGRFPDKKMYMVCHQTISIENTTRR